MGWIPRCSSLWMAFASVSALHFVSIFAPLRNIHIPCAQHLRLFLTFSSICFSVSSFMWRTLSHLNFSFVQRDKSGFVCILLHADLQLNQHYLLKIPMFLHWMVLLLCQRSSHYRCVVPFLSLHFYSIDLPACLCVTPKQLFHQDMYFNQQKTMTTFIIFLTLLCQ